VNDLRGLTDISEKSTILVVDLDGTLIHTDTLYESAIWCLFHNGVELRNALDAFRRGGIAAMKEALANAYDLDPKHLPYNQSVLEFLEEKRNAGYKLVLATGANHTIATAIAEHLQLFDDVLASSSNRNNTSLEKINSIKAKYRSFDYVGNSRADVSVWKESRYGYVVVDSATNLQKKAGKQLTTIGRTKRKTFKGWLTQLRPHQWAKNALLAVSIIASHRYLEIDSWSKVLFGFAAFSLLASAVYIFNDLSDLSNDRRHSDKRNRPLASGRINAPLALFLSVLLVIVSFAIAYNTSQPFAGCLVLYLAANIAYTFKLKKVVIVDVMLLAFMYTARIWAGAVLIDEPMSFWIASFSVFIFLSLALLKRYSEILAETKSGDEAIVGRGYRAGDSALVLSSGLSSAFSSVIFLALYLDSQAVVTKYSDPSWLWGTVPLLLGWLLSLWFRASRGSVNQDPIFFALRDKFSQVTFVALAVLFMCATFVSQ